MRLWHTLPLLLLASCSLQAKLVLQSDGSSDVTATFRLEKAAEQAWTSLRDLDPSLPADPFEPGLLKTSPGRQASVMRTASNTTVTLPIADLRRYIPSWSTEGTQWEGTIDRDAVRRWAQLTSWSNSPALDAVLPAPGTKISESEYRDLLVYLVGAGVSETQAKEWIDASTVQLTIVAPRPIRSAPGSVSLSDRTAVYRWPLLRVLTLVEPIRIRLIF